MPGDSGAEKTENATPKRRNDERKKGNVFMSKDIITVATLIVSFFTFRIFYDSMLNRVETYYYINMQRITTLDVLETEHLMEFFREGLIIIATTVLPFMLLIALCTVVAVFAQTKMLVSGESMKFKMSRLNILNGLKKFFSLRSLMELAKSLIKIILLIWLLYGRIQNIILAAPTMMDWDITQAAAYAGSEIKALATTVVIAFGVVAVIDYLYQRWEYEKGIKMTKQEVKDEYKQMEGNPEIKGKRRQKQQEMAMRRMMAEIPNADVVVRNPTHYAVALRYKPDDIAPQVLAKGADRIALKIIEEAEKYGVTIVENRPLARSLYELAQVDSLIPAELYQPVAELLAWIYTSGKKQQSLVT